MESIDLNKIISVIRKIPFNKYIITLGIATVWMLFFDTNSLPTRWDYDRKIHNLKREISFYKKEIEETKRRTTELQTNDRNLEKFAREQYLMKKEDEDIFIIEE